MDALTIIVAAGGGVITLGLGFILWYIKGVGTTLREDRTACEANFTSMRDKMQAFELDVARNYSTKQDFADFKTWLIGEFREMKDLLKNKQDKPE